MDFSPRKTAGKRVGKCINNKLRQESRERRVHKFESRPISTRETRKSRDKNRVTRDLTIYIECYATASCLVERIVHFKRDGTSGVFLQRAHKHMPSGVIRFREPVVKNFIVSEIRCIVENFKSIVRRRIFLRWTC